MSSIIYANQSTPSNQTYPVMRKDTHEEIKKTCQLLRHCKLRQPDAVQSLSALISSPVPSLNSLSLSVAVLERFPAYTLRYAVALNFDPVTLTFDL